MKKLFKLLLVFTLVFALVACGSNDTAENEEVNNGEETPVEDVGEVEETPADDSGEKNALDQIIETGQLVVGTSADYPPYEFHAIIDGKDKIVGFDMEFAQAIADELGVELVIEDMDFDAILAGVQQGMIDIGVAGINPSPDRAKVLDFSDIYFQSSYCVLTTADTADQYTTESDLDGKSIGVQLGTVQQDLVDENVNAENVVALGKVTDLVMQLKQGLIDAIVVEVPVADSYVKNNPDLATVEEVNFEDFDLEGGSAVIAQKGQTELVDKINEIIEKLVADGKIEEWYAEAVTLAEETEE